MRAFVDMSGIIPTGQAGDFSFEPTIDNDGTLQMIKGAHLVMIDNAMERRTNRAFLDAAHGDVLIAGLGIGFVIVPLLADNDVESILVVEKHKEIIDYVGARLFALPGSDKLRIVHSTMEAFVDDELGRFFPDYYDTIYLDLTECDGSCYWSDVEAFKQKQQALTDKCRFLLKPDPLSWCNYWWHSQPGA